MARGTIVAEVAFATAPLAASPTYVDVSNDLDSVSITTGRTKVLDRIEASTAQLRLRNQALQYSSDYASGPYYPNVVPRKKIRIGIKGIPGSPSTFVYWLFTGFIEDWQPEERGGDRLVNVRAVDAFKWLAQQRIDISRPVENSGSRFSSVMATAGYTQYLWANCISDVEGVTLTDVSPLQHLQDVATTENGLFYMRGDGYAVLLGRHYRIKQSGTPSGVFSNIDVAGTVPWEDSKISNNDTLFRNHVSVTLSGSEVGMAENVPANDLRADLVRELPLLVSSAEGQSAAEWILAQYNYLGLRVESITLNVDAASDSANPNVTVLGHLAQRQISDRITIKRYPFNNPALTPWTQDHFIEGARYSFTREKQMCTYLLSQADNYNYLIMDDPVYGRVDINRVAY